MTTIRTSIDGNKVGALANDIGGEIFSEKIEVGRDVGLWSIFNYRVLNNK
jgi:hypothetical protein